MEIKARPYSDESDLSRMRQLVMDGVHSGIPASYMHPGCLDWDTQCPPDEAANRRNLRLWECVDTLPPALKAWAIFSRRERTFDLFVSPSIHGTRAHETVMDEYVAWAEALARQAGVREMWPFWLFDYDHVAHRLLAERGFVEVPFDPAAPLFARLLDELPEVRLPDGFLVKGVANREDGYLRSAVTHAAFKMSQDWLSYRADYEQFMNSSVYDGRRDLFVRSPDGRGASACTLWFDPVNAIGLFEPVATHPDFQGRGLGKAVMAAGLQRMKAAGMRRAILGFDPNNAAARALYTSLGFSAAGYFAFYRREVSMA